MSGLSEWSAPTLVYLSAPQISLYKSGNAWTENGHFAATGQYSLQSDARMGTAVAPHS